MDSKKNVFLTIDAGGTFLKSALLDGEGEVITDSAYVTKSFSDGSREKILGAIREIILKGLEMVQMKGFKAGGVGIAFPGPFDYPHATPLMEHKFKNIYGVNLLDEIQDIPGISRDIPVRFIHDSTAVLAGEIWKGNAMGYHNASVVTLGTGLGFAFSQNGVIQLNSLGGPLIPVYKIPCRDGILEDFVSKRGLLRLYREISGKEERDKIKVSDIGEWADHGDEASVFTFREAARILAESLQELISGKEINCILFGGQISRSFHHMEAVLKQEWQKIDCLKKVSVVNSIENSAMLGILHSVMCPGEFVME